MASNSNYKVAHPTIGVFVYLQITNALLIYWVCKMNIQIRSLGVRSKNDTEVQTLFSLYSPGSQLGNPWGGALPIVQSLVWTSLSQNVVQMTAASHLDHVGELVKYRFWATEDGAREFGSLVSIPGDMGAC